MTFPKTHRRKSAGTLVLCLIAIAALTSLAAFTLQRVSPKFRTAYQTAAWQEARLASEAGIDLAMAELNRNAVGTNPGDWSGWKQQSGGLILPALATTLNTLLALLGPSAAMSQPIFLDNVNISAAGGASSEVDVQLWAVYPTANTNGRWFRIRSMATCGLAPPAYAGPDGSDATLRRYSLRNVRPQLRRDDVGQEMSIPAPSASRTIEVLVEPILPFELAILTRGSLSLSTTGTWCVDSYDSRDPQKSNPDGTYPGRTSPKVRENGNIASNQGRPANALFGPLISANGTRVRGAVATNGGDDPSTSTHENVADAVAIDPSRVHDDFFREMKPAERPTTGYFLPRPLLGGPFVTGPVSAPAKYLISTDLGAFSVAAPAAGTTGAVIIMVNGNLDVASGTIYVPPNVTVQIFVRGNIDFHDRQINADLSSCKRPASLQIFGEASSGQPRTLRASGPAAIYAAFLGPDYDVTLGGDVAWCGSVTSRSFQVPVGGGGGFHYDEALATIGAPTGFRIARYVEDVRQ